MKVKKKFEYEGIQLIIAEVEESYMNAEKKIKIIRVIAPNGGKIPIQIQRRQTLKSIQEETIKALDNFKSMGADVKHELTKEI